MRYKKWLAITTAASALFFHPFPVMATEQSCQCDAKGGSCQCDAKDGDCYCGKTLEQVAEEWKSRRGINDAETKSAETAASQNADSEEEEQKEKPRFVEILRDDSFIYWMDTKTAYYTNLPHSSKERMIDVWIKLEPVEYLEGEYTYPAKYYLEHYLIRPKTQQIQFVCELEVTGRPSNDVKKNAYDPRRWENLIPGSIEDSVYHAVLKNKGYIRDEASSNGTSIRDYIENTFNVSF